MKKAVDVVQCIKGHYYDGKKYEFCPHCGASASESNDKPILSSDCPNNERKGGKSFINRFKPNLDTKGKKKKRDTIGIFDDDFTENDGVESGDVIQKVESEEKKEDIKVIFDDNDSSETSINRQEKNITYDNNKQRDSFEEELKDFNQTKEGKTFGYFHVDIEEPSLTESCEPVVGWLVCIKGNHFGESFNITAGKNSIGRGTDNFIIISKDQSVSRSKHAWITYEPKKRNFYIAPGESRGLIYLNNDVVNSSQTIKALDTIEIGKSLFIFMPLCGEDFSWDNYI